MMILLFIQDILDGQLTCFLVIGSFDNGLNLQGHLSLGTQGGMSLTNLLLLSFE